MEQLWARTGAEEIMCFMLQDGAGTDLASDGAWVSSNRGSEEEGREGGSDCREACKRHSCCLPSNHLVLDFKTRPPHVKWGGSPILESSKCDTLSNIIVIATPSILHSFFTDILSYHNAIVCKKLC